MKLRLSLDNQASLATEHKFVFAVLKCLSISEARAANQLLTTKPSPLATHQFTYAIAEVCHKSDYSTEQMQAMTIIFQLIDVLAQLIANACSLEWKDKTKTQLKTLCMDSAKSVLPKFKDHLIEEAMKTYIQTRSLKILERMNHPEQLTDLDIISATLTRCFPTIDQIALSNCIAAMTQAAQQLQGDWVQVDEVRSDLAKNSLFKVKPSNPTMTPDASITPETESTCTVS